MYSILTDDLDFARPGVGDRTYYFSEYVDGWSQDLLEVAESGTPLFGICLGMQMLLTTSEEGENDGESAVQGLDLIPGTNVRFAEGQKVPHMGWNELNVERNHPLVDGVDGDTLTSSTPTTPCPTTTMRR